MRKIHKNILIMGWASLLTDLSSEMILPVLPIFITTVLGAPKAVLGLIEGIAETTASLLKYYSGKLSDKLEKRKPLVITGYAISTVTKPLLALARNWPFVLAIRFLERTGKGIRTSPRDALIADSGGKKSGRSFGFHRMMDTIGAVLGASVAFFILKNYSSYRTIFMLSFIPALAAVIVLLLGLKEVQRKSSVSRTVPGFRGLSKNLKKFILVALVFTLSNISYAFYLTRAKEIGAADYTVPLLYLIFTIVYAILAYPAGRLAEHIASKKLLATGYLVYAITAFLFAFMKTPLLLPVGFVLYGCFHALMDTNSRIVVAGLSDEGERGTAYGAYHTAVGLTALPANILAGFVWDKFKAENLFTIVGIVALLSASLLTVMVKGKRQRGDR